jgi:DNA-binding NarL/FixJ family response regulator
MKIRVALVDDDEKIRGQLSGLLEIYNSFDDVKELDNEQEANDYIFTNQVDAVFIKL